jgi:tetratricopeptide (TPR) repeat protein
MWMTRRRVRSLPTAALVVAGILAAWCGRLPAAERSHAFVEGLRQRQYYDTALDYLEFMRTSRLAPKDFRATIDYERGVTLTESGKTLPLVDREKRLNEARVAFEQFIAKHPHHWLVIESEVYLANLLIERGRLQMALASRFRRTPEEKSHLVTEARAMFQDSQKMFGILYADLSEKLRGFHGIDETNEYLVEQRNRIRTDVMQAGLALASTVYEIAKTYDPGTDDHKKNLQSAAEKFEEYNKKYAKWVGGYYAKVNEARCYQDLGDYSKATELLTSIREKAAYHEDLNRVRSVATVLAMQIAMLPQVKQYDVALKDFDYWETNIAQRSDKSEEGLAIKCLAGEAALEYARSVKKRNDLLQQAKVLLTVVTKHPSDYRRRARVKLADPLLSGNKPKPEVAATFDEARDRAKIAWDRLREGDLDPGEEPELRAEALRNYRFALAHAPQNIDLEELNSVRYYLAYLYFVEREYYEASVIGEFLARRYPNWPEAQQAAKLAMATYAKMVEDTNTPGDRKFEKDRMINMAQFITDRWPNSPAADEAWVILNRMAIKNHELSKATEYLSHVSAESPRRGEVDLLTGQTLWTEYVTERLRPHDKRPTKVTMDTMFAQAKTALESGVARMRKPVDAGGPVTPALAAAVLSLAQIELELHDPKKAIQWLDDPEIGPYTLIVSQDKVILEGNFKFETLKAALRAYVAAGQPDNLEETLTRLEQATGDVGLAMFYQTLADQLDDLLQQAREKNAKDVIGPMVTSLTMLLDHLAARPIVETTFATLKWTGDTYAKLGNNVGSVGRRPTAEAASFYRKAVETYRTAINACHANPSFAPSQDAIFAARMRLADCLQHLGKYESAAEAIVEILKVESRLIQPQRQIAALYQIWGEENSDAYMYAIRGGSPLEPKDSRIVWGWGGIARQADSGDSDLELFHEARYQLAVCRYLYAMSKSGQERNDLLNQAEQDITILQKLYPEMGGHARREQYDTLLRKIQRNLGTKEQGLKAIDAKTTAADGKSASR